MLDRFRQLPGARLAVAAFLVTVVAGVGGPPAYAWWSQQGDARVTAQAPQRPDAPTALRCNEPGNGNNVRPFTTVSWSTPSGNSTVLDIVALSSNGKDRLGVQSYAVPERTTEVRLADLPGVIPWLNDTTGNSGKLIVEVRNVWLTPRPTTVKLLSETVNATSASAVLEGLMVTNNDGFKC